MNAAQRSAVATGTASTGVSGAIVVILTWALGLAHVSVPGEVAAAMMMVASPLLHLVVVRIGAESTAPA